MIQAITKRKGLVLDAANLLQNVESRLPKSGLKRLLRLVAAFKACGSRMNGFAKLSLHEMQDMLQSELGAGPGVHVFSRTVRELGDPQDPADSNSWR